MMNQKSLIDSQIKELLYVKGQYIEIRKNILSWGLKNGRSNDDDI